MRDRAIVAALAWLGWTALAVFFGITASLTYMSLGQPPAWRLALEVALIQWWPWVPLTPLVVWLTRRLPIVGRRRALAISSHLTFSIAVGLAKSLAENVLRAWLVGGRPYLLINNVALQALIYWALVGFTMAIDRFGQSRARAAEAEARLRQTQVELLRTQLQPHFLFNALNAVSELVHEDPERADAMIGLLSDLLRATLDAADRQFVTLVEELALVDRYMSIQRIRFGDRLHFDSAVDPACRMVLVPHLCLQPLVENAVRHGVSRRPEGGRLQIVATAGSGEITIVVEDDGVGLTPGAPEGVGLANTRARLASLYAGAASFTLAPRPGGGTVASLRLPVRPGAVPG
jgi:two-component system LytT family sensor kinase